MYGTWRYNSKSDNQEVVQVPVDASNARPVVQQACNSCRGKKTKCSGEKTGCSRCKALSKQCSYTNRSEKRATKRRRANADADVDVDPEMQNGEQSSEVKQPEPTPQLQHELSSSSSSSECDPSSRAKRDIASPAAAPSDSSPETSEVDMGNVAAGPMLSFTTATDYFEPISIPSFEHLGTASSLAEEICQFPGADFTADPSTPESWSRPIKSRAVSNSHLTGTILGSFPLTSSSTGQPFHQLPTPTSHPATTTGSILENSPKELTQIRPPSSSLNSMPLRVTSPTTPRQEPCLCLQHVAFLVHELEMGQADSLDGQLVSHREAVEYGRDMMTCGSCSLRPENLMVFTFLSDRLLQLAETITDRMVTGSQQPGREDRFTVAFGELEIDSGPEWELLVANMVVLQLDSLIQVMDQLKENAVKVRAEIVSTKAAETGRKLQKLIEKIVSSHKRY